MKTYFLYTASAGSGKTFTIVLEYLKIVIKNPNNQNVKNILAITFTNKSASEMKSRILESLIELGSKKTSKYQKKLQSELNFSREKISNNSKKILTYILHHYSFFSIFTIDKFNLRLIRSFSKEFGIPQRFSLELNYHYFLEKTVVFLIQQIGKNNPYANFITDFVLQQYEEGKINKNIKYNLIFELKNFIDEKNYFFYNYLQNKTVEDIKKLKTIVHFRKNFLPEKMIQICNETLNLFKKNQISDKDFTGKHHSIKSFFKNAQFYLIQKDYNKIIEQSDISIKKNIINNTIFNKNSNNKKQLKIILPEIIKNFRKYQFLLENYIINSKIFNQLINLQLINELKKILEKIKFEEEIIFLSDFSRIIYENLNRETEAYIYEKIGMQYQYYFFDEFQDTSELQWKNFLPLVINTITQQNHSVFLVGDIKQSIYRFRGGKPELLINEIDRINRILNHLGDIKYLPYNYRSKKNIVTFNNLIYTNISNLILGKEYKEIYKNSYQEAKGEPGGRVQVSFFDNKNYEELVHSHILELIFQYQKQKKQLNDIAILFKNNKEMEKLSNFLINHNIPIITDSILFLNQILSVDILFNLIKWIENPEDKNLLFEFLIGLEKEKKCPIESEDFSIFIIRIMKYNLFQIIQEINQRYQIKLEFLNKEYLNTFDLCEDLIRSMNFNSNYQLYFSSILNEIYRLESIRSISIDQFLKYIKEYQNKIKYQISQKNNAVQLMTIHKSKGLEFPVVIYPNFNIRKHPKDGMYWFKLNEEDYSGFKYFYFKFNEKEKTKINVLKSQIYNNEIEQNIDEYNLHYVATTRSKNELFLIFPKKNMSETKKIIKKKMFVQFHLGNIFKILLI